MRTSGNVVLAMAEVRPVVVTQPVGAAEVVLKANAGLVAKGDLDSLAEAIRQLEADPHVAQTWGSGVLAS